MNIRGNELSAHVVGTSKVLNVATDNSHNVSLASLSMLPPVHVCLSVHPGRGSPGHSHVGHVPTVGEVDVLGHLACHGEHHEGEQYDCFRCYGSHGEG